LLHRHADDLDHVTPGRRQAVAAERVGRDVDDPHHVGTLAPAQLDHAAASSPASMARTAPTRYNEPATTSGWSGEPRNPAARSSACPASTTARPCFPPAACQASSSSRGARAPGSSTAVKT